MVGDAGDLSHAGVEPRTMMGLLACAQVQDRAARQCSTASRAGCLLLPQRALESEWGRARVSLWSLLRQLALAKLCAQSLHQAVSSCQPQQLSGPHRQSSGSQHSAS